MANGDNSKLTMLIIKWVLSLAGAAIIALASLGYNAIASRQDVQIDETKNLASKVEALTGKVKDAILGDSLQGRDILEVKTKLNDHIERHRP